MNWQREEDMREAGKKTGVGSYFVEERQRACRSSLLRIEGPGWVLRFQVGRCWGWDMAD